MMEPHTPTSRAAEMDDAAQRRAQQRRAFAETIRHIHDHEKRDEQPVAGATERVAPTMTNLESETP